MPLTLHCVNARKSRTVVRKGGIDVWPATSEGMNEGTTNARDDEG
jgi:hypothetical protein